MRGVYSCLAIVMWETFGGGENRQIVYTLGWIWCWSPALFDQLRPEEPARLSSPDGCEIALQVFAEYHLMITCWYIHVHLFISASHFEWNLYGGVFFNPPFNGKGSLPICSYCFTVSQWSLSARSNIFGDGRCGSECSLGNSFSSWCCKHKMWTTVKAVSWCAEQNTSEGCLTEAKIKQGSCSTGFTVVIIQVF